MDVKFYCIGDGTQTTSGFIHPFSLEIMLIGSDVYIDRIYLSGRSIESCRIIPMYFFIFNSFPIDSFITNNWFVLFMYEYSDDDNLLCNKFNSLSLEYPGEI